MFAPEFLSKPSQRDKKQKQKLAAKNQKTDFRQINPAVENRIHHDRRGARNQNP
ncbi:MAG: hypothetical protein WBF58_14350 [Xanthobacteraceae bacterium]